jgi:hypothetical protein
MLGPFRVDVIFMISPLAAGNNEVLGKKAE